MMKIIFIQTLKVGLEATLTNFNNIVILELSINFRNSLKLPPEEELAKVYFGSDIITEFTNKKKSDIKS